MDALRDSRLDATGVRHGFGTRDFRPPEGLRRPTQVHGTAVVDAEHCLGAPARCEADAIVCDTPGLPVAVVTADCVPILLAAADGHAVAAVHAGWRGLAAGVIGCGVAALEARGVGADEVVAVVGPHIGACCYEVDGPVLDAMHNRFGTRSAAATRETRPGHARIDLGALAALALADAGVAASRLGAIADACTACDAARFHSFRRDGEESGRLVHFIAPADPRPESATSRNPS